MKAVRVERKCLGAAKSHHILTDVLDDARWLARALANNLLSESWADCFACGMWSSKLEHRTTSGRDLPFLRVPS